MIETCLFIKKDRLLRIGLFCCLKYKNFEPNCRKIVKRLEKQVVFYENRLRHSWLSHIIRIHIFFRADNFRKYVIERENGGFVERRIRSAEPQISKPCVTSKFIVLLERR